MQPYRPSDLSLESLVAKSTRERENIVNTTLPPKITVKELLDRYPHLLQTFMNLGLMCPGCPTEAFHTLSDVAREYHLDLNYLLEHLNRAIGGDEVTVDPST